MAQAKITHPTSRAILGIVAVICIVVFANWLVRSTTIGNRNIDLTEDKGMWISRSVYDEKSIGHAVAVKSYAYMWKQAFGSKS